MNKKSMVFLNGCASSYKINKKERVVANDPEIRK